MKNQALYEKYKEGRHWHNHPIEYAERFSRFLKKQNFHGLLVDLGCGNGKDVEIFHKNGIDTLGIDCSAEELGIARIKYPDLKFEQQDIERLELEDNSVSAFFVVNVMHYVEGRKALEEIRRKLKSSGYAFIHFNLSITDNKGNIDLKQEEDETMELVEDFEVLEKRTIERIDEKPLRHTHKILELILRKR